MAMFVVKSIHIQVHGQVYGSINIRWTQSGLALIEQRAKPNSNAVAKHHSATLHQIVLLDILIILIKQEFAN